MRGRKYSGRQRRRGVSSKKKDGERTTPLDSDKHGQAAHGNRKEGKELGGGGMELTKSLGSL